MRADQRGFSLVELMVVVVVVGLLAGIAQPRLRRALLQARAAEAVADMKVVDLAMRTHVGEEHVWAPNQPAGIIPPTLVPYLPDNYSFYKDGYTLEIDNWEDAQRRVVAVVLVTEDDDLGRAVADLLGPNALGTGQRVHLVIEGWEN